MADEEKKEDWDVRLNHKRCFFHKIGGRCKCPERPDYNSIKPPKCDFEKCTIKIVDEKEES